MALYPRKLQSRSPVEAMPAGAAGQRVKSLLIVEPEALLRWSLSTYLKRWFSVEVVDSRTAAEEVLDHERVDAVILSADLPGGDAEALASHARGCNPEVCVICTFSGPDHHERQTCESGTYCLEKPFDLSVLPHIFGVLSGTKPRKGR